MTTELTRAQKRTAASKKWRDNNRDKALQLSREYNKQWRIDNKEKATLSSAKYRASHRDEILAYSKEYNASTRMMLSGVKSRCKKHGIEFNLTIDDILVPETCPMLGIPMEYGVGYRTDNSPSIDRIDNTKGYIKGNVHVISMRANRIKNDSTLSELVMIVKYMSTLEQANESTNN